MFNSYVKLPEGKKIQQNTSVTSKKIKPLGSPRDHQKSCTTNKSPSHRDEAMAGSTGTLLIITNM